jgi:putative two-component system response regulator
VDTWKEGLVFESIRTVEGHGSGPRGTAPSHGSVGERARLLWWSYLGDAESTGHCNRVARHVRRLAGLAGFDGREAAFIARASRFHDIGKIGVRPAVLAAPRPLTAAERREMQAHVTISHSLLTDTGCDLFDVAATIALTHHERYDGTGYPHGLCGTQIPIEGRITSIADVYDALTSPRVYRAALTPDAAIDVMRDERGRQFDPFLLDLFLDDVAASR